MSDLYGLVLSGGRSSRMGKDKGSLVYSSGLDQRARGLELLRPYCEKVFVSCRPDQDAILPEGMPRIHDQLTDAGPVAGLLAAWTAYPVAWLVLACDFPFADEKTVARLVAERSLPDSATAYAHPDGTIEPLFAIWEPEALRALATDFKKGYDSPLRTLDGLKVKTLSPLNELALRNVNSRADLREF